MRDISDIRHGNLSPANTVPEIRSPPSDHAWPKLHVTGSFFRHPQRSGPLFTPLITLDKTAVPI